ncbi:MAG: tRNA lysidine(34) synthetase TilS [Ruminococcaceae bacterium]|nr:tRNA lysidine(34) synthetase TilS [Oscillospiraceae bacterium]
MTTLRFAETLAACRMDVLMKERGRILAAYSGGADSSCLLRLLRDWCAENGVALSAAHVNHGIRGEEADRDEAFCRRTCEELGVPLSVLRADVPALAAEQGQGIEECARDVRYAYFDELAGADGLVATAHNATDNLETVLFRMLRGTGLKGLCGIPPIRDGRFLRPLIRDGSDAIRTYCAENGIPYVTDGTNLEPGCARNILRLNVLPELRAVFPDPEAAVSRMTELLSEDEDWIESRTGELLGKSAVSVSRVLFSAKPPAAASRILRTMAENAGGKVPEAVHVKSVLSMAGSGAVGAVSLPGGVRCVLTRDEIRIEPDTRDKPLPFPERAGTISADFPGGVVFENELCRVLCFPGEDVGLPETAPGRQSEENIYKSSISVSLCFDKIEFACRIRNRIPGDTIRFGGMTRRVKTLFSGRKLPEAVRSALPVIEDGKGVLWIPGFPPRDGTLWEGAGKRLTLVCQFRTDPGL